MASVTCFSGFTRVRHSTALKTRIYAERSGLKGFVAPAVTGRGRPAQRGHAQGSCRQCVGVSAHRHPRPGREGSSKPARFARARSISAKICSPPASSTGWTTPRLMVAGFRNICTTAKSTRSSYRGGPNVCVLASVLAAVDLGYRLVASRMRRAACPNKATRHFYHFMPNGSIFKLRSAPQNELSNIDIALEDLRVSRLSPSLCGERL